MNYSNKKRGVRPTKIVNEELRAHLHSVIDSWFDTVEYDKEGWATANEVIREPYDSEGEFVYDNTNPENFGRPVDYKPLTSILMLRKYHVSHEKAREVDHQRHLKQGK